jgi:hypothetical protein
MINRFPATAAVAAALVFTFCNNAGKLEVPPYVPAVVFSGTINSDQISWPGNIDYPNRCYLSNDTMMMYFYSQDYQEHPWKGDQLRLEIFHPDSAFIITHSVIFHLSRYSTGSTNLTYDVSPPDTESGSFGISMKIGSFAMQNGAAVSLTNIGVTPQSSGLGTLPAVITNGTITGAVEKLKS